jgi:hypothetical protein
MPDLVIPEGCTRIRDYIANQETGEIVALVQPDGSILSLEPSPGPARGGFEIRDDGAAEWACEKLYHQRERIATLKMRRQQLLDNLDAMIRQEENTLARMLWLFRPSLAQFTRRKLAGSKLKHWKTPFGKIGFRMTRRRLIIAPEREADAIAWASQHAPQAITMQPRLSKTALLASGQRLPEEIFRVEEPQEEWFYDTNIAHQLRLIGEDTEEAQEAA